MFLVPRVLLRPTLCLALTGLALPATGAHGQATDVPGPTAPGTRLEMYRAHVAMEEASRFGHLPWQFIGPTNVSGRMTDIHALEPRGRTYEIYVAGASGGVWRTDNEGVTWEPVLEDAASTSIGDVTAAPSNQDIVWVGTGEANIFRSSMAGAGVYKSVDGGETWRHMGLTDTNTIPRIVIHPTDPDIVWVAASGHEWTPNEERGVFRTTDGGETWEKVLYVDAETGAIDLVMDPRTPDRLYAATWQRTRLKWNDPRNESDYEGSGIWRTEDGGDT
ncbi:MAG: glycosyl hydrolase, partial [Gemmatimonadota bacterium]